eukprot:g98.t1
MIPTYFDLVIDVESGDIQVHDKIEGDKILLTTGNGDVSVKKIRGPQVKMHSGSMGRIDIHSAAEGRLDIASGTGGVHGKLLMGPEVVVCTQGNESKSEFPDIDIAALYSDNAVVSTKGKGDILLGTVQGNCKVTCPEGAIDTGSISGSINASAGGFGGLKAHFDVLKGANKLVTTHATSSLDVSIAAPVNVDLKLCSESGDFFHNYESNRVDSGIYLDCPTDSFVSKKIEKDSKATVQGRLLLLDDSSSTAKGTGSGKISHQGRAKAATDAAEQAADAEATLSAFAQGENAKVSLRVLSWVQMMREKIGLRRRS